MSTITDRLKSAWSVIRGDSKQAAPARRADSWYNATSGIGVSQRDSRLDTSYRLSVDVTRNPQMIRALIRSHPVARKIVVKQVELAFGSGLEWTAPTPEATDALMDELDRLDALTAIRRGRIWGRAYGGAVVLIDARDGRDPSEPLNPDTLVTIDGLHVLEREYIAADYGASAWRTREPEHYRLSPRGGAMVRVHKSRVLRFEGLDVDSWTRDALDGWGDSVLQPVWATLRDFGSGEAAMAAQLTDSVQAVYKIQGLHDQILAGNRDFVEDWIASVERFRSTFRAIGLDADSESLEYLARPMGESVEVYTALMAAVAAAADMPMTELFGRSPAGLNATGESDTRKWYDKIEAEEQRGDLDRNMRRLVNLIASQRTQPLLSPDDVGYEWPSLWSPTAVERLEMENAQAMTDAVYIDRGVFSPAEIRTARLESLDIPDLTDEAELIEDGARLTAVEKIQQGRLALDMLHLPATSQDAAKILGFTAPTPEQMSDYWTRIKGTAGDPPPVQRSDAEDSYTPPKGVQEAAQRALDVRAEKPESERGMTPVGIARARDLSNGSPVSYETIKRMKAYFDRHEVDKDGSTWSEQGKGWQAWHGWGGDPGRRWAESIVRRVEGEQDD